MTRRARRRQVCLLRYYLYHHVVPLVALLSHWKTPETVHLSRMSAAHCHQVLKIGSAAVEQGRQRP